MIIKSKVELFWYWFSNLMVSGGIILLVAPAFFDLGNTPIQGIIIYFIGCILLTVIYGKYLWDSNKLTIDVDHQTIMFKNRISQKVSIIQFSYFDGYISWCEPISGGRAKNIYLVKDKKFIKRLCSLMYSNFEEIEKSLSPIENLGHIKYSHWKSFKILLRKPIL